MTAVSDSCCQTLDRATFKRLLMPLDDKVAYHNEFVEQRPSFVAIVDQVEVSVHPEVVGARETVRVRLRETDAAADTYCARLCATRLMREQVCGCA